MAVEVIHEGHRESQNSGMSFIVGILLLIAVLFLFFYYLLPVVRGASSPQINVPGKIDVNVNQPK